MPARRLGPVAPRLSAAFAIPADLFWRHRYSELDDPCAEYAPKQFYTKMVFSELFQTVRDLVGSCQPCSLRTRRRNLRNSLRVDGPPEADPWHFRDKRVTRPSSFLRVARLSSPVKAGSPKSGAAAELGQCRRRN